MLPVEAQTAKVIEITEMIKEAKIRHEMKLADSYSVHFTLTCKKSKFCVVKYCI